MLGLVKEFGTQILTNYDQNWFCVSGVQNENPQNHRSKRISWGVNQHAEDAFQQREGEVFQDYWRASAFPSGIFRRFHRSCERETRKTLMPMRILSMPVGIGTNRMKRFFVILAKCTNMGRLDRLE